MNEMIKDFAEQSGSTHKQSLGVYQFYEHELEKFVELLVRECIGVCDITADGAACDYEGAVTCIDNIKLHFGVEP
jgi:hypothetical protein